MARFVEGQGKDTNATDTENDVTTAEQSRAGEGAKIVEGIEESGPTSSTSSHPSSSPTELLSGEIPQKPGL